MRASAGMASAVGKVGSSMGILSRARSLLLGDALQLALQRAAVDAEELGGRGDDAAAGLQRRADGLALELVEVVGALGNGDAVAGARAGAGLRGVAQQA